MVDRVGGNSGSSDTAKVAGKKRRQEGSDAPDSSGAKFSGVEIRLRQLLAGSGSDEHGQQLLVSGLIDAICNNVTMNFEDKERILLLVKSKIDQNPQLKNVFDALKQELARSSGRS